MNFKTQADAFMTEIQTRRRNPARPSTVSRYRSCLNVHILPALGEKDLSTIENGTLKAFAVELTKSGLKPATINSILVVTKSVIASAVDANGNQLYPRVWNANFIDAPVVNPTEQDAPTVAPAVVEVAISKANGTDKALIALLAGTGLRIGEALALMVGPDDGKNSFWNPESATLTIRTTAAMSGKIQPNTKTMAGTRAVDLDPELNTYLCQVFPHENLTFGLLFQSATGTPVRRQTMYNHLKEAGIPEGFHALRRYRCTHLEKVGVPPGVARFWTGHAAQDVHDRYVKIGSDIEARKEWAQKAGLGFRLEAA